MRITIPRLYVLIVLGLFTGFALGGDEPAKRDAKVDDDVFDHDRLCVTIWPATTQVKVGEEFDMKLRVVNSSNTPQAIKVWSCSWDMNWTWKNPRVGHEPWECTVNFPRTVQLQPGEAYEKVLRMKTLAKGSAKVDSLRMGFKPEGERKTYWSNEIFLGVK